MKSDQEHISQAKRRPYSSPVLTLHGSVRNLTGGSSFTMLDQFCGGSGNGFRDCFRPRM
ncbi:lasso RiPP family leader peptide-containing protein [Erythrobacter sp. F6033]|uniref:lasso RiPP family leader peptide-containing protein n=1 Tax=Erythrobacter sp. F6033 TaxID=2926401 RepID=UPI001FF6BACF|nr:lasso RiPP family leader peptide-containing protein [Erythrobacter sp. F6033]MCK0127991.1 lasso RiPP family leader peptide-containing protein [Erythrobacter sp. F6033]